MSTNLKIVLAGERGCGKNSLIKKILERELGASSEVDTTPSGSTREIQVDDITYTVELIESTSLSALDAHTDSDGFILVYSVTSSSFTYLSSLLESILQHNPSSGILLLGNKADVEEGRMVQEETGMAFAKENGLLFYECSAKSGLNVDLSLAALVRSIVRSQSESGEDALDETPQDDETAAGSSTALDRPKSAHQHTGPIVWEEEEEKSPFKRNPNLNMDRMKTQSLGGLGRAEEKEVQGGCCGCVVV